MADIDAALARIHEHGAEIAGNPDPVQVGGGAFLTLVRDPDGNLVEIVGPRRP